LQVKLAASASPTTNAELPAMENMMQSVSWAMRGRLDMFMELPFVVCGATGLRPDAWRREWARGLRVAVCHACAAAPAMGNVDGTRKDGFVPFCQEQRQQRVARDTRRGRE
jgi:hypothetical protein